MSISFENSMTKENLMRAFAGESQARNRYTMAASQAKKEGLGVIEAVFTFTANQEREHAEIFYNHLSQAAEEPVYLLMVLTRWIFPEMWPGSFVLPSIMNLKNMRTSIKLLKKRPEKKGFLKLPLLSIWWVL